MCTFEYQYLILTLNRFDNLFEFEIRLLVYVEGVDIHTMKCPIYPRRRDHIALCGLMVSDSAV
jgi:hypothetical protein